MTTLTAAVLLLCLLSSALALASAAIALLATAPRTRTVVRIAPRHALRYPVARVCPPLPPTRIVRRTPPPPPPARRSATGQRMARLDASGGRRAPLHSRSEGTTP